MSKRLRIAMLGAVLAVASAAERAEGEPFFTGLGGLSGGGTTRAWALSGDGTTVVGESQSAAGSEAFRWTRSTGMAGLGDLAGGAFGSVAYGVSRDGSVVVGAGRSAASGDGREAFRWTSSAGMVGLGDLAAGPFDSVASGVSADGSVVVGTGTTGDSASPGGSKEAFRWTTSGGMTSINPSPLGGPDGPPNRSAALGVSADGSVIAGRFSTEGRFGDVMAGAWTASGGWRAYPGPTAAIDANGQATAVSADGAVVVGSVNAPTLYPSQNAFAWDRFGPSGFLHDIPPLDLGPFGNTVAHAVSADGGIVVGTLFAPGLSSAVEQYPTLSTITRAFIWDAGGGFRLLQDVLFMQGFALSGWTLIEARGLSGDGRTVTGTGINPFGQVEAWYASLDAPIGGAGEPPVVIPEPSTLVLGMLGMLGVAVARRLRRNAPEAPLVG